MVKTDLAWGKVICFQTNNMRWRETNTESIEPMLLPAFQAYATPPFLTLLTVSELIVSADLSSSHLSLLQHRLSRTAQWTLLDAPPPRATCRIVSHSFPLNARQHFGFPSFLHPKALAHGWGAWLHPVVGSVEPAETAVSGTKQLHLTSHSTVAICACCFLSTWIWYTHSKVYLLF